MNSKKTSSNWFFGCTKCLPINPSSSKQNQDEENQEMVSEKQIRKPAGWKAMPFVLGQKILSPYSDVYLFTSFIDYEVILT